MTKKKSSPMTAKRSTATKGKKSKNKKKPSSSSVKNFILGKPLDTEISMGKGHGVGLRQGNQQYQAFIVSTVPHYNAMTNTAERSGLFKDMVQLLKKEQGRFFDKDAASGRYFEVCDRVAQAKVGQVRFFCF
jgi:hypothetical protein